MTDTWNMKSHLGFKRKDNYETDLVHMAKRRNKTNHPDESENTEPASNLTQHLAAYRQDQKRSPFHHKPHHQATTPSPSDRLPSTHEEWLAHNMAALQQSQAAQELALRESGSPSPPRNNQNHCHYNNNNGSRGRFRKPHHSPLAFGQNSGREIVSGQPLPASEWDWKLAQLTEEELDQQLQQERERKALAHGINHGPMRQELNNHDHHDHRQLHHHEGGYQEHTLGAMIEHEEQNNGW
eukprot:m.117213 g.117213  ORF g.117213 m.117213 type:complete len:239 (-) comp23071_c0_seq2:45-761(-)